MGAGASLPAKDWNGADGLWLTEEETYPIIFCWGATIFHLEKYTNNYQMGLDALDSTSWRYSSHPHWDAKTITLEGQVLKLHDGDKELELRRIKDPDRITVALAALAHCNFFEALAVFLGDASQPPRLPFRPVGAPANHSVLVPKMFDAVRENDTKQLLACLDEGVNVHGNNSSGWHVMDAAGYEGSFDAMEILVKRCGLDVNRQDERGWTCMHHGALFGKHETLEKLIELGASIDLQTSGEETPLTMAVMYNGSDPDDQETEEAKTETVRVLLKRGANRGIICAGRTPALLAASELQEPDKTARLKLLTEGCWSWTEFKALLDTKSLNDVIAALVPLDEPTAQPRDLLTTDATTGRKVPATTDRVQLHTLLHEQSSAVDERFQFVTEKLLVPLIQACADMSLSSSGKLLLAYLLECGGARNDKCQPLVASQVKDAMEKLAVVNAQTQAELTQLPSYTEAENWLKSSVAIHQELVHSPLQWQRSDPVATYHELRRVGRCADATAYAALLTKHKVAENGADFLWAIIYAEWLCGVAATLDGLFQDYCQAILKEFGAVQRGPPKKLGVSTGLVPAPLASCQPPAQH